MHGCTFKDTFLRLKERAILGYEKNIIKDKFNTKHYSLMYIKVHILFKVLRLVYVVCCDTSALDTIKTNMSH